MRRLVFSLLVLSLGCAHGPDTLTSDEHRAEAQRHQAIAQDDRSRYDPEATRLIPMTRLDTPDLYAPGGITSYNPTERWLSEADRQMREAAEHLRRAKQIESFEEKACEGIPAEQRSACPLLASSVAHVEERTTGVALHMRPGVDAAGTARMLQCHLAFAKVRGFDQPSCPLFVKGLAIDLDGTTTIDFHSTDPKVAEQVRAQARRIFKGPEEPSPPSARK
ncbi:MAG: hypothetical protein LUQ69_10070 [Methanoregulaceae archaeon]|nr:hypothetical protein [Methanoregulaceae archaeon]